jgi:hypothetical protein
MRLGWVHFRCRFPSGGWVPFTRRLPSGWDFFVDNIQFNVPLPNAAVPEPGMLTIAAIGGVVACGVRWLRPRKVTAA